jgi:energy-coupling factor transporter ATP-binding protein EcfA2
MKPTVEIDKKEKFAILDMIRLADKNHTVIVINHAFA